ncbi:MAG: hypothetical protein APR55_02135 [Methanolinea sp. SDB]|nr:MAG: hypothetical protein APR55_02135 [Methanolinea sp. SDB]
MIEEGSWRERITVIWGDITGIQVDAIVNAANETLLGGGGVDGAIHRCAGPGLLEECRKLHGCATGKAVITSAYRLPARFIIHTVGPVWHGGSRDEDALLASCYHKTLELAKTHGVRTLAFPAISTGAYGFPRRRAAGIAVRVVKEFLERDETIEKVIFVCHDGENCAIYQELLGVGQ